MKEKLFENVGGNEFRLSQNSEAVGAQAPLKRNDVVVIKKGNREAYFNSELDGVALVYPFDRYRTDGMGELHRVKDLVNRAK